MPHGKNTAMFMVDPSGKLVRERGVRQGSQRVPRSCITEDTKFREMNDFHQMAMFLHQGRAENSVMMDDVPLLWL